MDFTHMMLASGDCKKWVVMTTAHALEWIQRSSASSPTLRQALSSSADSEYHTVHALKRRGNPEDPTVYLESEGYAETCASGNFMYKGNRVMDCATGLMRANAGSNVFYHIGTAPDPCDGRHTYGGGWSLKRHVPVGLSWHPATDWLHGSEVYGTNNALPNLAPPFSALYEPYSYREGQDDAWCTAQGDPYYFTNGTNSGHPGCGSAVCCRRVHVARVGSDYELSLIHI